MDWKSQLASSIEAAVQAGFEAALQRSGYASVEESADEAARRRTSWFGEAGRRRIEREEDRVRRDPVWAEKMARRHAAFPLPSTAAPAPTPSTTNVAIVPELVAATSSCTSHASTSSACLVRDGDLDLASPITCSTQCPGRDITVPGFVAPAGTSASSKANIGVVPEHRYFDPKPTTAASTTTSTSTASTYILSACVAHDGDLEITSPTICSSLRPGSDTSAAAAPMMAFVLLGEPAVTTTCTARDSCIYPMAHPDDMGDCALAGAFLMAPPTIRPAVCKVVLTQAMLGITDSGSSYTLSMSTLLPEPEDADTAVMHADEQQLACSSVERPLAFVTARNVASDHSFFTSMSAMPLTLAAIGFADVCIASKHDVLLLLKLLEMSLRESKEQFVTPLPPQFTQVIVTWGTYASQLQAKCSGICSCLARTTLQSVFLLPWDPGEKIGVSRDSILSGDTVWEACLKQLNAELLGSYEQHQQPRELLWYRFDSVNPFLMSSATQQEFMDGYKVTCICNEAVLWPFLQSSTHHMLLLLPWDPGQPLHTISTKLNTLEHGLVTMLTTVSEIACLQGNSVQELFCCSVEFGTITDCMMALVQLQPWLSWKLSLSCLTWLECFCDILVCTAYQVSWTNRMVFNNDGYWCGPMQPIPPNLLHIGLHRLIWFIEGKLSCMFEQIIFSTTAAMLYTIDHADALHHDSSIGNLMLLSIAPAKSGMVAYLHYRGLPATDEVDSVDCVAPMKLVVSIASTYSDFSFTSFGMVAIISSGLDGMHAEIMLLTECVAWPLTPGHSPSTSYYVQPLRSTTVYFCGSVFLSWNLPCTRQLSSVWLSNHPGDTTRCCSQLLQWIFPRQHRFSCCTPDKAALHNTESLQGNIGQLEIENFQPPTVKLSYPVTTSYVCIARGCFFLFIGCATSTDHGKASSSIPWDPGGAVCRRLEGKPPIMEGGMLATTSTTTVGPSRQWACWYESGLGQQQKGTSNINTSREQSRRVGLGIGRLRPPVFCLRLPPPLVSFSSVMATTL